MAFRGCIAYPSGNVGPVDLTAGTTVVALGSELIDTDNVHDISNNSRFTIPSALNGKYGIFTANGLYTGNNGLASSSIMRICVTAGATTIWAPIYGLLTNTDGEGETTLQCITPPLLLTTGDIYQMIIQNTAGGFGTGASVTIVAARTNFSLQVID